MTINYNAVLNLKKKNFFNPPISLLIKDGFKFF